LGSEPDDPGPNLDRMVDHLDATESRFYFYDELDRLSRATDLSATDLFTYGYDPAGNRLAKTNAAGTTTYTYETGTDRLQDATGAEAAYYAHDAYGNRIYAGTTPYTGTPNYTYNDQNRLTLAANTAGGAPVPAVYDAFGRRVFWMEWVFVYDSSGRILEVSNREGSPWFGDLVWVEGELLGRVENNVPVGIDLSAWVPPVARPGLPGPDRLWLLAAGAGALLLLAVALRTRSPRWGTAGAALALVLVTAIACVPTGVAFYWVVTDHLGTPIAMTNTPTSGEAKVIWKASYAPFGQAVADVNPDGDNKTVRMPVRFPGQWWDFTTGLHYNFFRDYDPQTGRYLEADPIWQLGSIHLYAYADHSPVNIIDPLGWWIRNYTNTSQIVKPERGPIAVLPPMSEWDGSPDGIWIVDPATGDYRDGFWRKYPGDSHFPDSDINITPGGPDCVGGQCLVFPYKDLPVPPDSTWRLPDGFNRLPGAKPLPKEEKTLCE
jgi:RHS repeat-associated protein